MGDPAAGVPVGDCPWIERAPVCKRASTSKLDKSRCRQGPLRIRTPAPFRAPVEGRGVRPVHRAAAAQTVYRESDCKPSLFRLGKSIPNPPFRVNVAWLSRVGLELLSEAPDVELHIVELINVLLAPDLFQDP